MEHLKIVHTSFIVNFSFTNNVTILTGTAGASKSMVFSFIREHAAINEQLACINHLNYQEDIINIITNAEGKMIVIDNADMLLDDDIRKQISLDGKNQYLIIGNNPKKLFATKENLFELVSKKAGEQTEFELKSYL
ncbi:MAG: ABC transporter ATP-binding protein [Lachnospiraceae bacterium]